MKLTVLKNAEKQFLKRYPGGFAHDDFAGHEKKYKMKAHETFAREAFAKKKFEDTAGILADMQTLVSRSAMVSMFEKPKFKEALATLRPQDRERWARALYDLLHGKAKGGFEALVDELLQHKLAKWTLATVFQSYYRPQKEVFVKPNTTKLIIDKIGLDLKYQPRPTWEFYRDYKKAILAMRAKTDASLAPSNPAFCGFLMMTLSNKP